MVLGGCRIGCVVESVRTWFPIVEGPVIHDIGDGFGSGTEVGGDSVQPMGRTRGKAKSGSSPFSDGIETAGFGISDRFNQTR